MHLYLNEKLTAYLYNYKVNNYFKKELRGQYQATSLLCTLYYKVEEHALNQEYWRAGATLDSP